MAASAIYFHPDPGWTAEWVPLPGQPFSLFCRQQSRLNRFFFSSEAAYFLALGSDATEDTGVFAHLHGSLKQPLVKRRLDQYRPRKKQDGESATFADLRRDIGEDWGTLFETVVVRFMGAFELFLRHWFWYATHPEVTPSEGSESARAELRKGLQDLRRAPGLDDVKKLFPSLKTTLRRTLAMYSEVADEEARIERGMNCWEMPGMWREIRNLIVHHDSVAHTAFIKSNERTWRVGRQPVQSKTPNTDVLVAGAKLPLEARDVIHCFTHCNKTARVLQAQLDAWLVAPA